MRPTGNLFLKKHKHGLGHTRRGRRVQRVARCGRAAQSENWKSGSGVLPSAGWLGCSVFVGVVLPWEWEEEEWELSLELLRVSVLVLVFFIFLLLARGALSTF